MIRKLLQLERLHGKSFARALRKEMTLTETLLWNALRGRKFQRLKFRRQVPIGKYVVDFLSMAHHLVVEVDGPIHEAQQEHDENRDAALRELGYRILRFSNAEVANHLPAVLQSIERAIFPQPQNSTHSPSPNAGSTKRKDTTQHS
ncbi:MAG: endonuclease domain-containing protein [Candidatus Peribacteraceae bacterium]|nr:endonuclease domain-containing protein [Candidatus Peribacteraceae bacterium]